MLEERVFEWDEKEVEWANVELFLNWFAICKRTNAVYYFREWSRDCEDDFDENDVCTGEEGREVSWEAKVGLVQDQELVLIKYGFVGCYDDGDDDADDKDDLDKRWKWNWRRGHWLF